MVRIGMFVQVVVSEACVSGCVYKRVCVCVVS